MSAADEDKVDVSPVAVTHLPEDVSKHAVAAVPDDIWRVVVSFLPVKPSVCLSSSCSWLRQPVLAAISDIIFNSFSIDGFLACQFTSLQKVELTMRTRAAAALPILQACPQLRHLTFCCPPDSSAAASLPRFPQLESVLVRDVILTRELGETLAACRELRDVRVVMDTTHSRAGWRLQSVAGFLDALAGCCQLCSLAGVYASGEADVRQLCASLAAWPQLQQLSFGLRAATDAMGTAVAVSFEGVTAAIAASCPRLCSLQLCSANARYRLSPADMTHVGSMASLRKLHLRSLQLPESLWAELGSVACLETVELMRCTMDGGGWGRAAAFVAEHALTALSIQCRDMTVADVVGLFGAIATSRSLTTVTFLSRPIAMDGDGQAAAVDAVVDALLRSPVCDWRLALNIPLLALLRAWNGRSPAAAVTRLSLSEFDGSGVKMAADFAALVLRCLRSCAALRNCTLQADFASNEQIHQLVEAVLQQPLTPALLSLLVSWDAVRGSREREEDDGQLKRVGLNLLRW